MNNWTTIDWFLFALAFISLGRMAYYFRLILENIRENKK